MMIRSLTSLIASTTHFFLEEIAGLKVALEVTQVDSMMMALSQFSAW